MVRFFMAIIPDKFCIRIKPVSGCFAGNTVLYDYVILYLWMRMNLVVKLHTVFTQL